MKILLTLLLLIPSLSWGKYLECKKIDYEYREKEGSTDGKLFAYKTYDEDASEYLYIYDGRIKTAIATPDKMESEEIQKFYNDNSIKNVILFEDKYFDDIAGDTYDKENTNERLENLHIGFDFMEEIVNLSLLKNEGRKNKLDKFIVFKPHNHWEGRYGVKTRWIIINRYTLQAYISSYPPYALKKGFVFDDVLKYEENNPKPDFPSSGNSEDKNKWKIKQNKWYEAYYLALYDKPKTYNEFKELADEFYERMYDTMFEYDCFIVEKPEKLI
jgi:hypothetical protein